MVLSTWPSKTEEMRRPRKRGVMEARKKNKIKKTKASVPVVQCLSRGQTADKNHAMANSSQTQTTWSVRNKIIQAGKQKLKCVLKAIKKKNSIRNSRFTTSIFTRTHIFSLDTLTLTNIRYFSSSSLLNFSHQVEDLFNKVQTLIPTLWYIS